MQATGLVLFGKPYVTNATLAWRKLMLAGWGCATDGKIVDRRAVAIPSSKGKYKFSVSYEFAASDASDKPTVFRATENVSKETFDRLFVGQRIVVLYDTRKPERNLSPELAAELITFYPNPKIS